MKTKDEITIKEIKQRFEKLADESDNHLRACVLALIYILINKKLLTSKEFSNIVKATKQYMVEAWMKETKEKPKELDDLKAQIWLENLIMPKKEQK